MERPVTAELRVKETPEKVTAMYLFNDWWACPAFGYLAKEHDTRTRMNRHLPERLRYLGWCSWHALYTKVTEKKVREKARERLCIWAAS